MYSEVKQQADRLMNSCTADILDGRRIGLEKESLRVNASGGISQTDHPSTLGCALTHPSITTDFSEALLEMVTPPCESVEQAMQYLSGVHQYIVHNLPAGEHIWNTSMPCILRGGESVRIGEYGSSFSGQMKHAYRRGLALRYGRRMQAIAGIHFNHSMPESIWLHRQSLFNGQAPKTTRAGLTEQWSSITPEQQLQLRTQGYFSMMQNLLRVGWVIPFLFGASPALCTSFLASGEGEEFDIWNSTTRFAPYGTSLRMGKFGYRYREDQPIDLSVRHTRIEDYVEDIIAHVSTEHPPYAELGLKDASGFMQQLSTSRLQIENEFYSSVRPKQIPNRGELPIQALRERGVRYLELRSVDVNLFEPAGLALSDARMLELLMVFALISPVKPLTSAEMSACTNNTQTVAHRGREPGLELQGPDGPVTLQDWGRGVDGCARTCGKVA